jgi:hypothetical protein
VHGPGKDFGRDLRILSSIRLFKKSSPVQHYPSMAYTFVSVPPGGNNCKATTSQLAWFTTSGPLSTITTSSLPASLTSGTALQIILIGGILPLLQPVAVSGTLYLIDGNGHISLLNSATAECVVQQTTVLYEWVGYPLVTPGEPSIITSQPTLATVSPTLITSQHTNNITSSAPQFSRISSSPSHISSGLSSGAKAGIAVGAILGVALLAALATLFLCCRKRKKTSPPKTSGFGNQLPITEKEVASQATNLHADISAAKSNFVPVELDGLHPVAEDSTRQAPTGFTEAQQSTSTASGIPRSQSPDPTTAPEVYIGNEVVEAPIVVDPEVARLRAELEEISAQRALLSQLHALSTREQDLRRALRERRSVISENYGISCLIPIDFLRLMLRKNV